MKHPHDRAEACDAIIELATPADASAIALLNRDEIELGFGWTYDRVRMLQLISLPGINVVVARRRSHESMQSPAGSTILGFAVMLYPSEDRLHLLLLAVAPAWRRRAVATSLLDWLDQTALTWGAKELQAECRQTNATARRFYADRGFVEIARVADYYRFGARVEDGIRLRYDYRASLRADIDRAGG